MANQFPTGLNSFPRPGPTTETDDVGYELDIVIGDLSSAIEADEAKLGIGASTPAGGLSLLGTAAGVSRWLDYYGLNVIINGAFQLDPEVGPYTSTNSRNNDDKYVLGLWTLLSDGSNVVNVSQETTFVPNGSSAAAKLTWVTANKRSGLVYFLDAADAAALVGDVCSLRFKAATTAAKLINNLRVAILSWTGTADALTSDVVSGASWGASGADPTFAASWTVENVPSSLALTTSYQTFKVENVAIDTSGAKNVAVFFYCNDTDAAAADELFIADVKLVKGPVALDVPQRPYAVEQALVSALVVVDGAGGNQIDYQASATNAHVISYSRTFPFPMVRVPAVTKVGTWNVGLCAQPTVDIPHRRGYRIYTIASATANIAFNTTGPTTYVLADARQ